jgi:2'-5' RNA ligase
MAMEDTEQYVYDRMWAEATARFASGDVQIDDHLRERDADRRRGLTLIVRPSPETLARVVELIAELREREPEQYFYRADELHVTVLSLVPASEAFVLDEVAVAAFGVPLTELFERSRRFRIRFAGVAVSAGAALIQGYAEGDHLNQLRDAIRRKLAAAGLADGLDVRYRIVTAHATFMRFAAPPRDLLSLTARLLAARTHDFGKTWVEQIDLVANDWYMAHDRVQVLATYPLHGA